MRVGKSQPPQEGLAKIHSFLQRTKPRKFKAGKAISLFSGAGISDTGYAQAGFDFVVQAELEPRRAALGNSNFFADRPWVTGDIRQKIDEIVTTYRARAGTERPALLVGTPPCQGLSSSNPSRGQRKDNQAEANEEKNKLLLTLADVARQLQPRVIVVENVRQVRTLHVSHKGYSGRLVEHFKRELFDYELFESTIEVADYGIPQTRRRAILVAVHKDEPWLPLLSDGNLAPWPNPTHGEPKEASQKRPWVNSVDWFRFMEYPTLDSARPELATSDHPLHNVPSYERDPDRYFQISSIPPYQGRSAYQNSHCPSCETELPDKEHDGRTQKYLSHCPECSAELINRPYRRTVEDGKPVFRLIKGFASSYRRMYPDRPCSTVTTNTSHVGSDYKIHPYEHRVLSTLEVADLQTVPRYYNWSYAFDHDLQYMIRNVIGEAFPAYFTYLHGRLLARLLAGKDVKKSELAKGGKRVEEKTLWCHALVPWSAPTFDQAAD